MHVQTRMISYFRPHLIIKNSEKCFRNKKIKKFQINHFKDAKFSFKGGEPQLIFVVVWFDFEDSDLVL